MPWTYRLRSGRTLWDGLVYHYNAGVDTVAWMQRTWDGLEGQIDTLRFDNVREFLGFQEKEAKWWRDASLLYFQTFSHMPIPAGYPQPPESLNFYQTLRCPRDGRKPRCPEIYELYQ